MDKKTFAVYESHMKLPLDWRRAKISVTEAQKWRKSESRQDAESHGQSLQEAIYLAQ